MDFKKNMKYIIPIFIFSGTQIIFIFLYLSKYTIDKQAYFYTLSTISQTLAALIGLVGIFVIFRLQMLKSNKFEYTNQLRKLISKPNLAKVHPFIGIDASYDDKELLINANHIFKNQLSEANQSSDLSTFYSIVVNLRNNDLKYESYKKSILFSMIVATFAILLSII